MIEDLEIITELQRENFHVRLKNGATIFVLFVSKKTLKDVKLSERIIHCVDDVGRRVPDTYNVDNLDFIEHDAKFIIAIETGECG